MHFDDRLATVLRNRAAGERAAKTQFRQLIDLLGERPQAGDRSLKAAAYLRLIALGEMISVRDRAAIVGESGWRFRNPELVRWFGEAHPHIAAAALYRAQLTGAEWEVLIPQLPIRARGFLRHRDDMPGQAIQVLDQLGVSDRGLPMPEPFELDESFVAPEEQGEEPAFDPGIEAEIDAEFYPAEEMEAESEPEAEPSPLPAEVFDIRPPRVDVAPTLVNDESFLAPFSLSKALRKPESAEAPFEPDSPAEAKQEPLPEEIEVDALIEPDQDWSQDQDVSGPIYEEEAVAEPEAEPAVVHPTRREGIRELVDRIEAFQRTRAERPDDSIAPRLPLNDGDAAAPRPLDMFSFGTTTEGRIDWAERAIAPMVMGIDLAGQQTGNPALERSFAARQPIRSARVLLRGAARIEGDWIVDAMPRFTRSEGRFHGYVGRMRRAESPTEYLKQAESDRLRQLLHELRTPVNAMQGYAEIIQQQVIGPVPHEYRAIAATIAGDAAHILAGFDELDRLARLETGALDLEPGESDFAEIVRHQVTHLQSVLSPRVARFDADLRDDPASIALSSAEAERLAWRLLATIAGSTSAGETIAMQFHSEGDQIELSAAKPASLANAKDIFSAEARGGTGAVSAGIFGPGFSLRLARAEARAAGGDLVEDGDRLILSLPLLTSLDKEPLPDSQPDRAVG